MTNTVKFGTVAKVKGNSPDKFDWVGLDSDEVEDVIDKAILTNKLILKKLEKHAETDKEFEMLFDKCGVSLYTILQNKLNEKVNKIKGIDGGVKNEKTN